MKFPDNIRKEDKNILIELVNKTFSKDKFIEEEVLHTIAKLSLKLKAEISIQISRKGEILDINVGDKSSTSVGSVVAGDKLSQVRVIHTHPYAEATLSELDLTALRNLKLDAMCAVSVDDRGLYDAEVAFLQVDGNIETMKVPNANYLNKYGVMEKMLENDKMYTKALGKTRSTSADAMKAVLVLVDLGKNNVTVEEGLEELKNLAKTAGIETVDSIYQKRAKIDPKYFIGEGKLEEIRRSIQINAANVVIFDNELSGSKLANVSNALGVKVIDRSMLILDIFAGRAKSNEGKLQVELAQLKYSLPRLNSLVESKGRYGGGVGMRGPGETQLELNRRVVENNIVKKTKELEKLKKHRELNRSSRFKNNKPVVAIVGYTNSGKSTLLNTIAKAQVYAKDELFATLDTTTRSVWLGGGNEVLLTDTVGFINNLPHEFIEAFGSTLEESVFADLLLHVVDISNPNHKMQEEITLDLLKNKLKCTAPILTVYNKIDKVTEYEKEPDCLYISARENKGIENLKDTLRKILF